ncbi:MAG: hypothetical protein CME64_08060 [Halobacteriovoraceae bacterium]|nr:hypothetical protein [Halobacteriovoraceae bacterium]|tara:strand:- start:160950 stop:161975 length:1026 start_codon:yes stop_codon:yes gene_type:complete
MTVGQQLNHLPLLIPEIDSLSHEEFLQLVHLSILEKISSLSKGHLRTMTFDHFENKGKMLRPSFVYKLAKSLGVPVSKTFSWAQACEILHNATLIHDDIQDEDEVRRGRATMWKKYGSDQAINVGDFLLVLAPSCLHQDPNARQLLSLFSNMTFEIVNGQANEMALGKFEQRNSKYFDCYLDCISGKTSALFAGLAAGVGFLNGSSIEGLKEIFYEIGHLYQMQDDIIDLYGDKKRGEQGCDIKEGKLSFLVALHLDNNPDHFGKLTRILLKPRPSTNKHDIDEVKQAFLEHTTLAKCLRIMKLRSSRIMRHEELQRDKNLHTMVINLLDRILTPLEDLEV